MGTTLRRALVLSGGGSRGAAQAGAIYHLLSERSIHYDIITGVSVGALNGAFASMFYRGQEREAAEGLRALWWGIKPERVYRKWYGGILGTRLPFLWRGSLYSTAPLQALVRETIDAKRVSAADKILRVGAVNLESRERRVWAEDAPNLADVVLASAAFPPFFEPIEIDGHWYVDDGVQESVMVREAIEAGADHIDIIECSTPGEPTPIKRKRPSGMEVASRCIDAMGREIRRSDLLAVDLYNALIQAGSPRAAGRRLITYNHLAFDKLAVTSATDFTNERVKASFWLGRAMARNMAWKVPAHETFGSLH